MDDLDLDRIRQVWRELPDVELARALKRPDDYPPGVQAVIQQEVARRELDSDALDVSEAAEPDMVVRFLRRVHAFFRAHPLAGAACLGFGLALTGWLLVRVWLGSVRPLLSFTLLAVHLVGLVYLCWPLRRYKRALFVTLVVWVCQSLFGIFANLSALLQLPLDQLLFSYAANLVILCAIPFMLLSLAVYVRNTYWPVYAEGHCAVCGYNLQGLTVPRCPECGTPFGPERQTAR